MLSWFTTLVVVVASVSIQNRAPLNFSLSSLFIEVGCLQINCNSGVAYTAFTSLNLYLNHECCCRLTTLVVVLASVSNHFFLMTTRSTLTRFGWKVVTRKIDGVQTDASTITGLSASAAELQPVVWNPWVGPHRSPGKIALAIGNARLTPRCPIHRQQRDENSPVRHSHTIGIQRWQPFALR